MCDEILLVFHLFNVISQISTFDKKNHANLTISREWATQIESSFNYISR